MNYNVNGLIDSPFRWECMRKRVNVELSILEAKKKEIRDDPLVVEFGSGDGLHSAILENYGYKVFRTDINNHPNIDHVVDLNTDLPFLTNYWDMILAHNVLEHIPYNILDKIILEFGRILKPNGVLSFSLPHRRYWFKLGLRIPRLCNIKKNIYMDKNIKYPHSSKTNFQGVHQWELNKKYTLAKIKEMIISCEWSNVDIIYDDLEGFAIARL